MKYWLMILLFMMAVAVARAGTETIDPDATIYVGAGWDSLGCGSGIWACLSDDSDPSYAYMYDNNNQGSDIMVSTGDPSTTDSTIVSTKIRLYWSTSNVSCTPSIIDSVAGQSSSIRTSSAFTAAAIETFQWDSVTYTSPPDGGSYTWPDIDNLIIGFEATAMANNKYLYISEIEAIVEYTAAGGGNKNAQVIIVGGQ